jgi:hypothetical protein
VSTIPGVVVVVRASLASLLTESTAMDTKVSADVTLSGRPVMDSSRRHKCGKGSGQGGKRERDVCEQKKTSLLLL